MIEAPARLSANGEYGYPIPDCKSSIRVTLNGDSKRLVVAYNIEENWCEVICTDDAGKALSKNGEWVCKREYGRVQAIIVD